jgi:hypothetical protein
MIRGATHIQRCGAGWVSNTASDSSKEQVVHTHTVFMAEQTLISKATPPTAIMSLSKMQHDLLPIQYGYFKWHCFMNCVWVYPLFKERNKFGEYHHVFNALRMHLMKFFEYWRMPSYTLVTF